MTDLRNYIEELTERVEAGRKAGQSIADLQKTITVASLKSLQSDGYAEFLTGGAGRGNANPAALLQSRLNTNTEHIYNRLDAV